ncbi:MAG: class II aldolase/adducin family protein [Pseudomonadota bacterium]
MYPRDAKSQSADYDPAAKTATEAVEQLVLANRILAYEKIFDYLGHVTVRNPENPKAFFISRSLAPEQVTERDILEVDFEGNVLTRTTQKPYSERIIHGAIYKARPDVHAVIHAHPQPLVILSVTDIPVRIINHSASVFYEGVPVYDEYDLKSSNSSGMLVRSGEEGERVARTLGKSRGMLMRGHGCNVVGQTVPHAVQAAIALRDNVVMQLEAQKFGQIKCLSYDEAKLASAALSGPERGWNYWVARVKRAMPDL